MALKLPRWDELTHRSILAYRFRQKLVMEPLKQIAARTPWFDRAAVEIYSARQEAIWSQFITGSTVLEAACGPGAFSQDVARRVGARSYTGADISRGMVRGARRAHSGHEFLAASAGALPFRDGAYDVLVACFLFHHVPVAGRWACLAELLRVAKRHVIIQDVYGFPGGIARPLYEAYYRIADGSYYRYTLEEWERLFESHGVRVVDRVDSGPSTIVRRVACWVLQAR